MIDISDLYDFCIEWQIEHFSTDSLESEFKALGWNFSEFKILAQHYRLWHNSMNRLEG